MANENVVYPGQIIGVIGESNSNLSLITTAKRMGFKVAIFSNNEDPTMIHVSDYQYMGDFNDKAALKMFAERCDVVIYNNDQIGSDIINYLADYTRIPQNTELLDINQDRLIERSFFETLNMNMVPYSTIIELEDLYQAINSIGYPAILKPIQRGLMGGQELYIEKQSDIVKASGMLDTGTYILESYVKHDIDYTVVVTRSADSDRVVFPVIEDIYHQNRLITSFTPAQLESGLEDEMNRIANEIANNLDYVGTFEVSFFVSDNGSIYVNKIAPNVGIAGFVFEYSLSIDQIEQHLRAIAGLPLMKPIKGIPTVLQTISENDYSRIQTQWVIKDNWHFNFYGLSNGAHKIVGHILIPTESIPKTLMQLEGTNIWRDVDFETKYKKMS
ncbi:ATP-grasp domain-containing protein [Lentilactobacillus sp. SPB1-3]|uniref:ATP-grasp domain-containing protein n=1 Tax=Lentilactobacillus terminaliae TaxID=3003483 RepID=A0ACD5DGG2_9LACO|nr:ATP-grasp domain-containing protein [Lentilactobacillus sp. SPB1-3]MCZ0976782.1 ATP-grasp domain-containing protein [Lentilactobacillus sp. SPB1-3]